ncbi:MAG: hypothetical protein K0R14_288 [Burkholderiales bacterium]|jgi:hypothetical protein|nr:hypothetical protein [Burkholderiales bacterium]
MKFNLITSLRSIGLALVLITTYFTANAYTITACFKVDKVYDGDDNNLTGYAGNWKLLMSNIGNISDNFTFPDINLFVDNTDYCLAPVRVDDATRSKLLTNTLYLVSQDHNVDPIAVPAFPANVLNYCKLEFSGTYSGEHYPQFWNQNRFNFTVQPIDCQFPDSAGPNQDR